jgi:tetratricopeptide (TPR) repeat protein
MKRLAEARVQVERGLELDPLNPLPRVMNGFRLMGEGRYAEAVEELEALLRVEPDNPAVYHNLMDAYHGNGNYDDALRMVRKFFPGDQELGEALDRGYAEGGYRVALVRYAETLAARPGVAEAQSMTIAQLYEMAGEKERTLEWLEIAYQAHHPNLTSILDTDLVRDDPRFQDLLRRMGLPQ